LTHRVLAALAALIGMIACGGSDTPTKPTSTHAISSIGIRIDGSGQHGFVGEVLGNPISVQVVDSSSRPIIGTRRVRFSVAEGGGSVSDTVVLTAANGVAAVHWTLGRVVGEQQLVVSLADDSSHAEQRVVAQALPLDAADVVLISGATSGTIGVLVRKDDGVVPYTLIWPDTILRCCRARPTANGRK
jgi:hypothetical protein